MRTINPVIRNKSLKLIKTTSSSNGNQTQPGGVCQNNFNTARKIPKKTTTLHH